MELLRFGNRGRARTKSAPKLLDPSRNLRPALLFFFLLVVDSCYGRNGTKTKKKANTTGGFPTRPTNECTEGRSPGYRGPFDSWRLVLV